MSVRRADALATDFIAAVMRNRPTALLESWNGKGIDIVSAIAKQLDDPATAAAFIAALSAAIKGGDGSEIVDWLQLAANRYGQDMAEMMEVAA